MCSSYFNEVKCLEELSFWIPAFWTIVFIEPLSYLMPTALDLNLLFLWVSLSGFKVLFMTR